MTHAAAAAARTLEEGGGSPSDGLRPPQTGSARRANGSLFRMRRAIPSPTPVPAPVLAHVTEPFTRHHHPRAPPAPDPPAAATGAGRPWRSPTHPASREQRRWQATRSGR